MARVLAVAACLLPLLGSASVTAQSQPNPPRRTAVRDLLIDGTTNDLVGVNFVRVSAEGVIAVGQGADYAVRFFSPTGAFLGAFGRKGSGPGELQSMSPAAGWSGKRVWVQDYALRRVLIIEADRKHATILPIAGTASGAREASPVLAFLPVIQGISETGEWLVVVAASPGVRQPPAWASRFGETGILAMRLESPGAFKGTVARIPRFDGCKVVVGGETVDLADAGLCATPSYHVAADATRIVILESFSLDPAKPASYRLTAIARTGDTLFSRLFTGSRTQLPARVSDSIRAARVREYTGQTARDVAMAGAWRSVTLPSQYPLASEVLTGPDGSIWVKLRANGSEREWLVLDAKGNPVGSVMLPRSLSVEAVDRSSVWGTEENADGVESVVRYRIRPPTH